MIGDNVSIGHHAIVHGCTLHDNVLIGMGAIVMDNAVVHSNTIIAAGAVVLENTICEAGSIYARVPAKGEGYITGADSQGEGSTGLRITTWGMRIGSGKLGSSEFGVCSPFYRSKNFSVYQSHLKL